uniref:RRM domain-containing protein n=3 Tax=Parascaris univalens TaxID=6257 RepID=A0A915A3N6_PARUN
QLRVDLSRWVHQFLVFRTHVVRCDLWVRSWCRSVRIDVLQQWRSPGEVFDVEVGGEERGGEGGSKSLQNSQEWPKILICSRRILIEGRDNWVKYPTALQFPR